MRTLKLITVGAQRVKRGEIGLSLTTESTVSRPIQTVLSYATSPLCAVLKCNPRHRSRGGRGLGLGKGIISGCQFGPDVNLLAAPVIAFANRRPQV